MRPFAIALLLFGGCDAPPPASTTPIKTVPVAGKTSIKDDFESDNAKWAFPEGTWTRRGGVLVQTSTNHVFNIALLQDRRFSDVDVTVKIRPVSGKEDASGGIVVRAKDGRNYLIVRANALEENVRLYAVKDGSRNQLASARVAAPKLGEWHTLRVVAVGDHIQAHLNGTLVIDHHDATFTSGWVGLWTKADSVTEFDDLTIEGTD